MPWRRFDRLLLCLFLIGLEFAKTDVLSDYYTSSPTQKKADFGLESLEQPA